MCGPRSRAVPTERRHDFRYRPEYPSSHVRSEVVAVLKTSDDAREFWRVFGGRHGVSVAALLEAFGRRLPVGDDLPPEVRDAVEEARAIDVENRRRG